MIVADGIRAVSDVANWAPNIPIIMVAGTDPVAGGVAASLARPCGMVTGVTGLSIELSEKYLELLLAAAAKVKCVGFLGYSRNPNHAKMLETARRSVAQHSVEARFAEVASPEEIEPALSRLAKEGAQALVVLPGALLGTERQRILRFALAQRWPVVGGGPDGLRQEVCSVIPRIFWRIFAAPPTMWIGFSRAPNRQTCRSNSRPNSNSSST